MKAEFDQCVDCQHMNENIPTTVIQYAKQALKLWILGCCETVFFVIFSFVEVALRVLLLSHTTETNDLVECFCLSGHVFISYSYDILSSISTIVL